MPREKRITPQEIFERLNQIDYIYSPYEIEEYLATINALPLIRTNKGIAYYNIPAAFDIETTSFLDNGEKAACMYEWTLNVCGLTMIGRTWEEWVNIVDKIASYYNTNDERILIIYIHNLAFEFQFMRKWFEWAQVFSLKTREPVKARTTSGIEFRCSYKLSGYSLAKVGENLQKYKVQKLVGDLDYKLYRNSATPLTDKEIGYCVNDCKVVVSFILEEIERNKNITHIPLTKTSYVRRYCRKECMRKNWGHSKEDNKQYTEYLAKMHGMAISPEEYPLLKRAFAGGFTHCSCWYSGQVVRDVTSFDFTSSYPTVLIAEQYPMSKGELLKDITIDEARELFKKYCCIFDIRLENVQSTNLMEHYISKSKCFRIGKHQEDNGRIVWAEWLETTITEIDLEIIDKYYTYDNVKIGDFYKYSKGYLPTNLVKAILKLYADKTQLKGVEGKEVEYLQSKEMLNSCYGMMVTDICRPEIIYSEDNEWNEQKPIIQEAIEKYNKSKSRFLFYPWGIYCTAYARRNLILYGILPARFDYVYSDTDSIKILNGKEHLQDIENYNKLITYKLQKACDYHGIGYETIAPFTQEGKQKPLGVWDNDGEYKYFKSLGAKRYIYQYPNDEVSLTVSGLNKKICVPYLLEENNIQYTTENRKGNNHYKAYGDISAYFDGFTDGLFVPAEKTGKNIHTYIDEKQDGIIRDYLGNYAEYHERSSAHLTEAEYSLSLTRNYLNYIMGVQGIDC